MSNSLLPRHVLQAEELGLVFKTCSGRNVLGMLAGQMHTCMRIEHVRECTGSRHYIALKGCLGVNATSVQFFCLQKRVWVHD